MGFEVGKPRHTNAGRRAGTPNKSTTIVKAALIGTFEELGGRVHMLQWAQQNPTEFYKLLMRLLPMEITGEDGGPIQCSITVYLPDNQRE